MIIIYEIIRNLESKDENDELELHFGMYDLNRKF